MHAKKLVKWGVALTSTLVLGGVVGTEAGQLLGGPNVVYAQEVVSTVELSYITLDDNGFWEKDIKPSATFALANGETYSVVIPPTIDGYRWVSTWYSNGGGADYKIDLPFTLKYYANGYLSQQYVNYVYEPVEQPVEQPVSTSTEQPAEKPVEKPVETPTDQPTEKPATTPTEQPAEKPVEQPTDQPVEKPVETPTEKPTATSLLAGNTASKAQTGATTDKKKVDNSTPSTDVVKSEEGSQATAKTLPKTGDSSSMLLMLGGLLSGLSGLGLAASSRKRD